jgi:Protein of unknown function (DUF992)
MLKKLAVAIGALGLAAGVSGYGTPVQAQAVKAGALTCNVAAGFGFIFGSSKAVNCNFAPVGGPPQHYVGSIDKFGVDIGYTSGGVLIWTVLAGARRSGGILWRRHRERHRRCRSRRQCVGRRL